MTKNTCAFSVVILGSILASGCQFSGKSGLMLPTAPSANAASAGTTSASSASSASSTSASSSSSSSGATGTSPAAGTWAAPAIAGLPNLASCSNLQWQISSLSATAVDGNVSALCGGVVNVSANITGQMSGADVVLLSATGTANGLGLTCPFALNGTGHIQSNDAMQLDYTGATCIGPVSGSQLLHRSAPAPPPAQQPPAASEPDPEPPQPTFDDGIFGCPTGDHQKLVECVHSHINPHNEFESFEVTKRVAWGLRGEGAGLLIKTQGENIVAWKGYIFAAGRICYPDGHIIKVISDVGPGGANGPIWLDNGYVDRSLYLPALDPTK